MLAEVNTINYKNIICPECGNVNIIQDYNTGDIICSKCGLVIMEKIIDQGPEWRAYNNMERNNRKRTGLPTSLLLFDKGLSTTIDKHDKDIYGNRLTPKKKVKIYRLRKWNRRTLLHDSKAKNFSFAMTELDRISSQLQIPNEIKKSAAFLYRKALKSGKIKGRNIIGMVNAALYISCRINEFPLIFTDFVKFSKLNEKKLRHYFNYFLKVMNIKIPVLNPKDFVSKFCSLLNLSITVQNKVNLILDALKGKKAILGKNPIIIVAAAIYIAAILENEKRTQSEIAKIIHISEVSLRNRYKEIVRLLKIKL